MKLFFAIAALTFGANSANVRTVSVVPTSGRAQVVIGVDASVEVDDFLLESPYRIVIDLKGASLDMAPRYDKHQRGGVTNIRAAQFKPNVVRVVIEMDAAHPYEVSRADGEVRVDVQGGTTQFDAWSSSPGAPARAVAQAAANRDPVTTYSEPANVRAAAPDPAPEPVANASTTPDANITSNSPSGAGLGRLLPPTMLSEQPRITVTYQDADIRDVIAAFASFSGRTIVVGKDVQGTITAEIKNQPWDVALRAILQGQGLAAAEDALTGIITVDSYKNIAAKQSTEPLVTQLIAVNYASAASLVPTLTGLLAKDCTPGGVPEARQNAQTSCFSRGAVAADTATNTLLITETPSRIADLIGYVKSLDVRTPQVAIKAKIIFVNRTNIEELGLSYDLGTG